VTTGQEVGPSLSQPTPTTVDLAYPIVDLIHELRPDLPLSVVASLVVECLDVASCLISDREWAEARQRSWPECIRIAHSHHTSSYGVPARPLEQIGSDYMKDLRHRDRDHLGRGNGDDLGHHDDGEVA